MSETLEKIKADRVEEEERNRIAYNSRIGENYRKIMTMDCSELKNREVEERKYPSLDAYRPLHSRRELTFEDVQIPEEMKAEVRTPQKTTAQPAQGSRVQAVSSSAMDYKNSIYADPVYRQAALRKANAVITEPHITKDTLSMPTSTTLQYGRIQPQTEAAAAVSVGTSHHRQIATAAEDTRVYYAALAKKMIVAFAVAFVVMMVAITVNSAILNGLDMQIIGLQQTLSGLQAQAEELQQAIADETSWETIWEYIQANGMILNG